MGKNVDKYRLVQEGARYRVIANTGFTCHNNYVAAGQKGGLVDGPDNLSQEGSCWITTNAVVQGNAVVKDDAVVKGNVIVSGDAIICQNATICDDCQVSGNAVIRGNTIIEGSVWVKGNQIIGRDISDGVYTERRGQYIRMLRDCKLSYNRNTNQLLVEDYVGRGCAGSCALRVNIASAYDVSLLKVKKDGDNGVLISPNNKIIWYAVVG